MIYRHQWKDHISVYHHTEYGFCKLTIFELRGKTVGCLHDLIVYPEQRGHGKGQFLLAWAIGAAKLNGCDVLILWSDGEPWVKEWYTRTGFVESDFAESEDGGPCLLLNLSNEK